MLYFVFRVDCSQILRTKLVFHGFNDWKHLSERIKSHDSSIYHKKSNQEWLELSWRIDSGTTLDSERNSN